MPHSLVPDDLFGRVLRAREEIRAAYAEPLTVASLVGARLVMLVGR